MPKLKKSDIEHVAKLAKLSLTSGQVEKFKSQLSGIVNYVSHLNEVDTEGVAPTSQTTGLENVKRDDEVKTENCLTKEKALSGTDKVYNGYFVVPGILEERTDK